MSDDKENTGVASTLNVTAGSLRPKLTQAQIENWRRILTLQIGPYAQIMPDDDIQAHADAMQSMIDAENAKD